MHLAHNNLHDIYQSAYRHFHSTETALFKVHSDIAKAIDQGSFVALLMNDLSAAFDTIDHEALIERLSLSFGIRGKALSWFKSYLQDRKQQVMIGNSLSSEKPLQCGVPQGSVLGPILYCLYTKPVGRILAQHGMSYHCYADDSQAYTALKPKADWYDPSTSNNLSRYEPSIDPNKTWCELSTNIKKCMLDLEAWMSINKLKLNKDKFEYIIFHSRCSNFNRDHFKLTLQDLTHDPETNVRNLGVIFDECLKFEQQTKAVARACRFQLRSIGRIRSYLDMDSCKTMVNALVTSRLDYCNSLLYGTTQKNLNRLQLVQNSAARLIQGTPRDQHITPVLHELHWLPVKCRITFKLLVLCYKSLQGTAPTYINVEQRQPDRDLRERNSNRLHQPIMQTVYYGSRFHQASMAREWNRLPIDLRMEENEQTFKKRLKTLLFREQFLNMPL